MRCAVVFRPTSGGAPPPPGVVADMMRQSVDGMSAWLAEYRSRFTTLEFFAQGGGFGVLDVSDSGDLQRLIATNPASWFCDVEVWPVVEPEQSLQMMRELAQASVSA